MLQLYSRLHPLSQNYSVLQKPFRKVADYIKVNVLLARYVNSKLTEVSLLILFSNILYQTVYLIAVLCLATIQWLCFKHIGWTRSGEVCFLWTWNFVIFHFNLKSDIYGHAVTNLSHIWQLIYYISLASKQFIQ